MKRRFSAYSDFKQNNSAYKLRGKNGNIKHSDIFSVVSLAHGTGCTHFALALANYISRINRGERVALIIKKQDEESDFIKNHIGSKVDVFTNGNKDVEKYRLRIYDIGKVLMTGSPECDLDDRSSDGVGQRFVLCNDNEDYYYELDKYTRAIPRASGFVYLFNRIPKASVKRIGEVMTDYSYNFIPSFRVDMLDEITGLFELYVGR